ncbi:DNA-processing protein DprA [Nocardia concava]|uniref:DNA-processing protein DprA n=1 Tax=Nocardia concava TaxID=257281 RepID=UPI0002F6255B|nr:DNA-processing protein DprA [Nocardia concava]
MTVSRIERLSWALLARTACGPSITLFELVGRLGAVEAAAALRSGAVPDPVLRARVELSGGFEAAARDLDRIERRGGRLVTPDDDEWPRELLSCLPSGSSNPGDVPPLALWVRGAGSLREIATRAITLTGTRASTSYGDHVAAQLAGDLCSRRWAIVAGAGYGIEARAHTSALAAGGVTVAVLPCGLDLAYPSAHKQLLDNIAAQGVVVSEHPPGSRPVRFAYLDRNRLLAALSSAVVAVEAGVRSGTASTLRWAQRFDRPGFAVPGPITSAASAGCHRFIADGLAQLATSADEIVHGLSRPPSEKGETPASRSGLTPDSASQ